MNIEELTEKLKIKEADFDSLSNLDFVGVYILYDPNKNDEVVYIGSAYARTIKERLSQYISEKDTGNTLIHSIYKKDYSANKVNGITGTQRKEIIKKIKSFKIKAIQHRDLEYQLIQEANPKYNLAGTKTTRGS